MPEPETIYSPADFADATWEQISPIYRQLSSYSLSSERIDGWLAEWSAFESVLSEAQELASIAYATDTSNPGKEAAHLRFSGEIAPRAEEARNVLAGRLLAIGSDRVDLQTTLRRFQNANDRFREVNIPLSEELHEYESRYQKITGGMSAEWNGERIPLTRLTPFVLDPDRDRRELAYHTSFAPFIESREQLADIFDAQVRLRQKIAHNAGSATYRDYAFRERNRFDYTAADCATFHDAIEQAVIPAIERRYAQRKKALGIERLRPWDIECDPLGRPALTPFTDIERFVDIGEQIFRKIEPDFGAIFQTMRQEGLLDIDARQGKRAGGFCSSLDFRKRTFIFMNAAGIHRDVETLIHEGGHAFHAMAAFDGLPLHFQREPDIEMAEVASMTLELLALPWLTVDAGGYYSKEDAVRAEIEQLERVLTSLAWIATVDAFQHWIYTHPEGGERDARDKEWCRIFDRFAPWLDWSGIEEEQRARWYRQLHIFLSPFYYIEYGIARLGALQVWRNTRQDYPAAISAFRSALRLGGTRPLPDLFAAAGARFAFDRETVRELVAMVEQRLAELEECPA